MCVRISRWQWNWNSRLRQTPSATSKDDWDLRVLDARLGLFSVFICWWKAECLRSDLRVELCLSTRQYLQIFADESLASTSGCNLKGELLTHLAKTWTTAFSLVGGARLPVTWTSFPLSHSTKGGFDCLFEFLFPFLMFYFMPETWFPPGGRL